MLSWPPGNDSGRWCHVSLDLLMSCFKDRNHRKMMILPPPPRLVIWEVLHLTRSACRNCVSFLRIALLLLLGASACACRVWYTSGTQIARMDPYSNPIAGVEDPLVRAMSYALVHGMRLAVEPTDFTAPGFEITLPYYCILLYYCCCNNL